MNRYVLVCRNSGKVVSESFDCYDKAARAASMRFSYGQVYVKVAKGN